MQTGQNVLKLLGQYPKATKSLIVVGIVGVLGLTKLSCWKNQKPLPVVSVHRISTTVDKSQF